MAQLACLTGIQISRTPLPSGFVRYEASDETGPLSRLEIRGDRDSPDVEAFIHAYYRQHAQRTAPPAANLRLVR